jgi:hypothetical protein
MIKRKTVETIKEYDENGKLTRETITETTEDDDTAYYPYQPYIPFTPATYNTEITCDCKKNN